MVFYYINNAYETYGIVEPEPWISIFIVFDSEMAENVYFLFLFK